MRINLFSMFAKETDWFEQLTREQQDEYITNHPRSKYANARRNADKEKANKPAEVATKTATRSDQLTERAVMTKEGRMAANGKPLPEHVQKVGIPPAWTDVRFNPDPNAELICTGRDAKGRLQPVYSEKFSETQAAAKFARVQALMKEFSGMQDQNKQNQRSKNPRIKDSADCMSLIMKTGLRPGSDADTGAEKKAYGATNLKAEHVVLRNGKVTLEFTGKKGVDLKIPVDDPAVAAMLKKRKKEAGEDGRLFPKTNDGALLEYAHTLDGGHFKVKDFRTHHGTRTALEEVAKMPKPANEKEYKKSVMAVAKVVSQKLGNTPTIALQSYISPTVFADWRM